MRDHIRFHSTQEFLGTEDSGGVASVQGVDWFLRVLQAIEGLVVVGDPLQEDWGVIFSVKHHGGRFWIGLAYLGEREWLTHLHFGSVLQRFSLRSKQAILQLTNELATALRSQSDINDVLQGARRDLGIS